MSSVIAISEQLKRYLDQLSDLNRRWMDWLQDAERAALRAEPQDLVKLQPQAERMQREMQQLVHGRKAILQTASANGLVAHDLNSLATLLPEGTRTGLKSALRRAHAELRSIHRLQVASWVLMHKCLQAIEISLMVMNSGHARRDVYVQRTTDNGGQLLDANL